MGGLPGVDTAFYCTLFGYAKSDDNNRRAVLEQLTTHTNRRAKLVSTMVGLRKVNDPEPLIAVGRVQGEIARLAIGEHGFGFDPVMYIPSLGKTMAQLIQRKERHQPPWPVGQADGRADSPKLAVNMAMKDIQHYMRPGLLQLPSLPPLSLYIHLPWCIKKCPYCDFNSHESKNGQLSDETEQRYLDALIADLDASLPLIWGRPVHSIFIGGGTPSLFSPQSIDQLLGAVRARVKLDPDCEITLEANPGTFEKDRFKAFRAAGVNRLSIGVQSFNDEHLKALGRVHNSAQAKEAIAEAATNFEAFNLDIMYALPGQTVEQCEQDIARAQFQPAPYQHLSPDD